MLHKAPLNTISVKATNTKYFFLNVGPPSMVYISVIKTSFNPTSTQFILDTR